MLMPPPPSARRAHEPITGSGDGLDGPARFVGRAIKGQRNDSLFWAACRAGELVAKRELSEAAAVSKLTEAAAAAGLTGREAMNTIASGLRAGKAGRHG